MGISRPMRMGFVLSERCESKADSGSEATEYRHWCQTIIFYYDDHHHYFDCIRFFTRMISLYSPSFSMRFVIHFSVCLSQTTDDEWRKKKEKYYIWKFRRKKMKLRNIRHVAFTQVSNENNLLGMGLILGSDKTYYWFWFHYIPVSKCRTAQPIRLCKPLFGPLVFFFSISCSRFLPQIFLLLLLTSLCVYNCIRVLVCLYKRETYRCAWIWNLDILDFIW